MNHSFLLTYIYNFKQSFYFQILPFCDELHTIQIFNMHVRRSNLNNIL